MTFYDAIIVGAGAAGASTAYFLGEAGWRVLVLEKESLPRYKACGGGVSLPFLKSMFPFSFDSVIETSVSQINFSMYGITVTIPCQEDILVMVMRDRFDSHILSHAKCDLRQGSRVCRVTEGLDLVEVEIESGEIFTTRYLVGADGANSTVARQVGLYRSHKLIPAIEAEVVVSADVQAVFARGPYFIFDKPRYGYLWVFPKKDHLSVGVAALHCSGKRLKETLARVMGSLGITMENAVLKGHSIPLYSPWAPLATSHTLLVGDAAGLVDPLSGEGIRPAIKSGKLAAEALLTGHPERYPGLIRTHIGLSHFTANLVGQFFYPLRELCLLFGAPNPFVTQAILDLVSDNGSALELLLLALLTLPIYLPIEIISAIIGIVYGAERENKFRTAVYPGKYDR